VINEVFVKGNVSHGGIISIFSRKGDMAGIDLAPGSYFFDFQSTLPAHAPVKVEFGPDDRVPELRNTVYWNEDLMLHAGSPGELTFLSPRIPGDYIILVRGLAHHGHVYGASAHFSVK
jgi:hypothetical protein